MKLRIAASASRDEAAAIAGAVVEHVGETVEVYVGDSDEPNARPGSRRGRRCIRHWPGRRGTGADRPERRLRKEIAIMGPEAAINAVYANKLDDIDDPEERAERERELREQYREDIDAHRMASEVVIDEIVPPSDLRAELAARFELYQTVGKQRPEKKHGTIL